MKRQKLTAALLAVLLIFSCTLPVSAAAADFDSVTNHIALASPRKLAILYPAAGAQTTAAGYQITGSSDPKQDLTMNGKPVEGRGAGGTFAVYVALDQGDNVFTFRQGDQSAAITITKGSKNSPTPALASDDTSTKPLPQFDLAIKSGVVFTLKCYAPAGTAVTATVGGKTFQLAKNGGWFSAKYTIPGGKGTVDLGPVTYQITSKDGATTKVSEGHLFSVGPDDTLQVQVKNAATTIFQNPTINSNFVTTGKVGAVDNVVGYNGDMYKLSMGGWISAKTVTPLTSPVTVKNKVDQVSFSSDDKGETFTFSGTTHPMYRASQNSSGLTIILYKTTGIAGVDTSASKLFSGATVTEKDGNTTIAFTQSATGGLWGYVVEYSGGNTMLYCKNRPRLSGNSAQPLSGITVAVDAGHGGSDTGALGITYGFGVTEKDINLATAVALKKKLEGLGAGVVMLRTDDSRVELSPRVELAQSKRVDYVISVHANSVGYTSTAAAANGVEVYYYEPIAKNLAARVEQGIVSSTGRKSRGAKYSCYVITLNSYAPSILVEMGFMLNPWDFDSMCSKQGIYNTVTAISDGIVATLGG